MRLIKNLLFNNKFPSDKYDKLYLFIIGLLCDVTLLILFLCVYVFFFFNTFVYRYKLYIQTIYFDKCSMHVLGIEENIV